MGPREGVIWVSSGHEYVDGTRGSGIVSSAADVLGMRLSVFGMRWCMWGMGRGLVPGSGMVGWCYVCVSCESRFFL